MNFLFIINANLYPTPDLFTPGLTLSSPQGPASDVILDETGAKITDETTTRIANQ